MKITLFTSNKLRHNYLINLFSNICEELFVVQETRVVPDNYLSSDKMKKYFENVNKAQEKIFDNADINNNNNIKILPMLWDDLSKCTLKILEDFLKSDIYIVFGSSYIQGDLLNYLCDKKTINIHMGVSPYYRGTDCNFWALYDNNPHLVGATIHFLSKGLDSGPILYHALSNLKTNTFEYTMSTVKSAFHSLCKRIEDNSIFKIQTIQQDRNKEIRYSKRIEFDEKIVENFFKKNIDLNSKKFDLSLLKDPYFLE